MGQDAVLQISVDLLDPGMFAVGLVNSGCIHGFGSDGGEEGVEAGRIEKRRLP